MEESKSEENNSSIETVHSRESSLDVATPSTAEPFNVFQNQIELERSSLDTIEHEIIFTNYIRYKIKFSGINSALEQMRLAVNPGKVNALNMKPENESELIP